MVDCWLFVEHIRWLIDCRTYTMVDGRVVPLPLAVERYQEAPRGGGSRIYAPQCTYCTLVDGRRKKGRDHGLLLMVLVKAHTRA